MLETADLAAFVPVSDLARAQVFYEHTLGLRVRSTDNYGCMLNSNGTTLRLAKFRNCKRLPSTVVGWGAASIEKTVRSLRASGVEPNRYGGMGQYDLGIWTAPSQDRVAWFSDSEGNTLSVTQSYGGNS